MNDLADRLGAELHRRAAGVTVPPVPFDARRPARMSRLAAPRPEWAERDGRPGHGNGRSALWVAFGAAAAVMLVAVGLRLASLESAVDTGPAGPSGPVPGSVPRRPDLGLVPVPGPPPVLGRALVPGWMPPGYELWALSATGAGPGPTRQSLHREGAAGSNPGVSISVGPGGRGDAVMAGHTRSGGTPVRVRGLDGSRTAEYGTVWLVWDEQGVTIEVQGPDVDEAAMTAMVESLAWRAPDDPMQGFAPPADPRWSLAAEMRGTREAKMETRSVYGRADGSRLTVVVAGASAIDRAHPSRSARARADGSLVDTDALGGVYVSFDDGRLVTVVADPWTAGPADQATVERIADGAVMVEPARLRQLRAEVSARLAARPAEVAVDLPTGRATMSRLPGNVTRFEAGRAVGPYALCLTVGPGAPVCGLDEAGLDGAYTGLLIDDRWYAVLATPAGTIGNPFDDDGREAFDWTAPPGEGAEVGSWRFRVAVVPEGVISVRVKRDATPPPDRDRGVSPGEYARAQPASEMRPLL
jgi:hypothetical protein